MPGRLPLSPLPIDELLPQIVTAVRDRKTCVLVAEPGAGKTTRVPGAILDSGLVTGEIVVLQPRRIAARLAAARVASERGTDLGREVGYEIRFDRKASADTRIRFVTEGVLTRRLLADPDLRGVGCVIVDEFHERHLDGDLALALCARLRERRPDLVLVVMSATLDAEPVAAYLGDAPILRSAGRTFPIDIEYLERDDDRHLGKQVASAVRRAAQAGLDGDILVFLPGAGEIRRAAEDLEDAARVFDLAVLPLHGDLTADQQDAAVRKSDKRKVILATNVAETSVTIDGVVCVIDSGLARIARHSPWSGLPSLQIEAVSRASCTQRAGRAGRTRPGRVMRLYTKHDHDGRRAFEIAEVARTDLSGAALELYGAGIDGLGALRWFESPPPIAAQAADDLLLRLGAIESWAGTEARPTNASSAGTEARPTDASSAGTEPRPTNASSAGTEARPTDASPSRRITALGRRMLRFPVHPRQGRLVCDAEDRGVVDDGCTLAAVLNARELRLDRRGPNATARVTSTSDVLDDLDALATRSRDLDRSTVQQVERTAQQLQRIARTPVGRASVPAGDRSKGRPIEQIDDALKQAILAAYPDRVGKRRAPRSADFVFAGGGGGTLSPASAVLDAELIVAVDVAETGTRGMASRVQIRRASAIDATWLLEFADRIVEKDELEWNASKHRVERVTRVMYDGLAIDETRGPPRDIDAARAAQLLAREAIAAGIEKFLDADAFAQWRARVALVARVANKPELAAPEGPALEAIIARACDGATSFADLRSMGLLELIDGALGEHRQLVARLAPMHVDLPRKKRVAIHYELDRDPWIASRMQDFFGLARAPTVGGGAVPLVLHLLAPNQRPVQVTQDLPGFWVRHYPGLRNQLARRYPRHQWPEDPTQLITE